MVKNSMRLKATPNFRKAIHSLNSMSCPNQCRALHAASNKFIRDVSTTLRQVRRLPPDQIRISPSMRKRIYQHRRGLHTLADGKTSIKRKRKLLTQKGGFFGKIIASLLGTVLPVIFSKQ